MTNQPCKAPQGSPVLPPHAAHARAVRAIASLARQQAEAGTSARDLAHCATMSCGDLQRTLRRILEYLPQSTRVLAAKYNPELRTPLSRLRPLAAAI